MTKLIITVLLVALICALLILRPAPATAADTCPTPYNVTLARLDITDGSGRHYLIDVNDQAFAAATGNVAELKFQSKSASKDGRDHWLVNGVVIDPDWKHVYHITFMGEGAFGNLQNMGDIWFATLAGYDDVYFWYILPVNVTGIEYVNGVQQYAVEWSDHPNCSPTGSYGSAKRETVDELLRPRK
jgi:hypothetical protein